MNRTKTPKLWSQDLTLGREELQWETRRVQG